MPLTVDDNNDFAKAKTWKKMSKALGDADWPVPSDKDLRQFGSYRQFIIDNSKNIDYTNVVYVAGRDKSTPSGYEVDENGGLVFLSTAAGDQSVTWESGIPQKMTENGSVYYTDVSHGALANEPVLFKAIDEILAYGSTLLLKKNKPVIRATEESFKTPDANDFDLTAEGIRKYDSWAEQRASKPARDHPAPGINQQWRSEIFLLSIIGRPLHQRWHFVC